MGGPAGVRKGCQSSCWSANPSVPPTHDEGKEMKNGDPVRTAERLQALLGEMSEHDNITSWVLHAASKAARDRAAETGDLEDAGIVALLEAVDERTSDRTNEITARDLIKQLCAMLQIQQG